MTSFLVQIYCNSNVRTIEDIPKYGIKTFFFSDVCSAYRRDIYFKLGGFEKPLKTNEDLFFAVIAIKSGYKKVYAANAQVLHSHNLSLKMQYKRNCLIAYELEKHKNLLSGVGAYSEGLNLIKYVMPILIKQGNLINIIIFFFNCCVRLAGNIKGKRLAKERM